MFFYFGSVVANWIMVLVFDPRNSYFFLKCRSGKSKKKFVLLTIEY